MKCNLLVDNNIYEEQYQRIKKDLGKPIVAIWPDYEKTDPKRYVYEDCGILAYLHSMKQALNIDFSYFADLGSGNGLLTHLLTLDGFKGCGIDARTRSIWKRFIDAGTDLRKVSINPSDPLCPEIPSRTDFLIGNHTDELTPWVVVLAARRKCNFWLLPCCYYNFYHKFVNKPTNKFKHGIGVSKYDQYLDYIHSIATQLGFKVQTDKLRTSSSKRVCFIGTIPPEGLIPDLETVIQQLLTSSCHGGIEPKFKPISDTVDPRNCTQLPQEFKRKLVTKMAFFLLGLSDEKIGSWRCGGEIHISELSKQLTDDEKPFMKSQFGGLHTFLKNHSGVFDLRKGIVRLKRWPEEYEPLAKKMKTFKKLYCWFYCYHPDGCPVVEELCPFAHTQTVVDK
ncbi:putative tRNA (uracil-O(2)-)-methyltransferase [Aphelenchoides bicaudatus]|nr:putative tRNA (uracil-O(2)-)-methyltransferase [Aphelenchoides bicaudatus]